MNIARFALSAARLSIILTFALALPSNADTVYTYTGNSFNEFFGTSSCPSECRISGSFTVSTQLAPSSNLNILDPIAFSFTDGALVFTETSVTKFDLFVTTDSSGAIIAWNNDFINGNNFIFSGTNPPGCVGCSVTDTAGDTFTMSERINNNPGTWSSVTGAVPEPSSLLLLGSGFLAVLRGRRRKLLLV